MFVLLMICTCAYIRNVPKLKEILLSEKNGIFGALYKGILQFVRIDKFCCY